MHATSRGPLQPWVRQYVDASCTATAAPHAVHVTGRGGYQTGMSNKKSKNENAMAYYKTMEESFAAGATATCAALQAADMPDLDKLTYTTGRSHMRCDAYLCTCDQTAALVYVLRTMWHPTCVTCAANVCLRWC
jgi:hypothetical protein